MQQREVLESGIVRFFQTEPPSVSQEVRNIIDGYLLKYDPTGTLKVEECLKMMRDDEIGKIAEVLDNWK